MKTEAVLFDLDGTLLNTLDDLTDCVNHTLNSLGLPLRSIFEIKKFIGDGVYKLIERSMPTGSSAEEIEYALSVYRPYYKKNMQNKTVPYDGIMDLLTSLKEKNIKVAVISNKQYEATQALCLDVFGNLVDISIGVGNDILPKPNPGGVSEAMRRLNVSPENVFYVGDTAVDMQTAENAKIKSIAVTWGFRDRCVFEKFDPVAIVDKPDEILKIL